MVALPTQNRPYLIYSNKQPLRKENRPYQAIGAALDGWRSARREILLCGPAGTGKSRGILQKLHFCSQKYPGARILICRKTRHSITQTAMVTYEKKVLPEGWLDRYVHFNTTEQQYEYVNGSVIAVGGLDKPSKIMSSEWDMIYPQEAIELLEDDWEALTTRLRNGVMPYQQLIGDTNPGPPTHWLKKRCDRGATKMLHSRHEDNPSVTKEYLATLDALTGVRKKRLRDGLWAAAEGMVYDEWDPNIHIITMKQLQERKIIIGDQINRFAIRRFVAGVDWGYKNPGVIQVYGIDGDGRKYLFREVYQTRRLIGWWVEQAKALHQEFGIETFFCDPSEPAYIMEFNNADLNAIGATNDIVPGIDTMKQALAVQPDGRPGFCVYEFALQERDQLRDEQNQPIGLENEINEYVYEQDKNGRPVKELPVKLNDHACDAARYVCMGVDGNMSIQPLGQEVSNAISQYVGY
jgi:PBSX family phage terminase large subunit